MLINYNFRGSITNALHMSFENRRPTRQGKQYSKSLFLDLSKQLDPTSIKLQLFYGIVRN